MFKHNLNTIILNNPFGEFFNKKKGKSNLQILLYHRILNNDEIDFLSNYGMVYTSTKNFEDNLKWFKQHKYNILNFRDLSEILKNDLTIPPKTIILTFDDGSIDHYRNAVPLLKRYDFSATFFPIKNCVYNNGLLWLYEFYLYFNELGSERVCKILQDIPRLPRIILVDERLLNSNKRRIFGRKRNILFEFKYLFSPKEKDLGLIRLRKESSMTSEEISDFCQRSMNSNQIKELIHEGFEIGSHGVHHYPMSCLTGDEKKIEIEKEWIERLDPEGMKIFSLPFGSHSLSDLELFNKYDFVLTTRHETYCSKKCGPKLGRFAVEDEPAKILSKRLIK